MDLVTTGLKQSVDTGSIRDRINCQGISLLEGWRSGLFSEGKQGDSPGVAHACCDAIDREKSTTKQFAAAVSATVAVAGRFAHWWLAILVP